MTQDIHNIVIIGGIFAEVLLAHTYFQKVLPLLESPRQFRLTMISPATQFHYTLAGLRALVNPEMIDNSSLYQDFSNHFEKYKNQNTELYFVHGIVKASDEKTKFLQVQLSLTITTINYDLFIIASGTATTSPAFKMDIKSTEEAKSI